MVMFVGFHSFNLLLALVFWIGVFLKLFHFLVFEADLPKNLAPNVVILIAPPATIFIAYYELTIVKVDVLLRSMIYYALFLFILLLSMPKALNGASTFGALVANVSLRCANDYNVQAQCFITASSV